MWNSERKFFGSWSNKPEITGKHQLWWNYNKTAIACETDTVSRDPNGHVLSNQETKYMVYDGKTFRIAEIPTGLTGKVEMVITKKPTHAFYSNNYFQGIGWQGDGSLKHVPKSTEPGEEHCVK